MTKVRPKRSYTANSVPLTTDLEAHELAINWVDGKAFTKDASGNLVTLTLGGGGGSGATEIFEAATTAGFPATGSAGVLYVSRDASRVFRWDSSGVYIELGN
jgi:hypothetical protein